MAASVTASDRLKKKLLTVLKERDIPLEVRPHNVCTGAVPSLLNHSAQQVVGCRRAALGDGRSRLFFTDLLHEYTLAAEIFGFSREEIRRLAANSLRYRFGQAT